MTVATSEPRVLLVDDEVRALALAERALVGGDIEAVSILTPPSPDWSQVDLIEAPRMSSRTPRSYNHNASASPSTRIVSQRSWVFLRNPRSMINHKGSPAS